MKTLGIGMRAGGPETDVMSKLHGKLIRAFADMVSEPEYCPHIQFYGLTILVDGSLTTYSCSGVCGVRLYRTRGYIHADIGFLLEDWFGKEERVLQMKVAELFEQAFQLFCKRIAKERWPFDADRFLADTDRALLRFLNEPIGEGSEAERRVEASIQGLYRRDLDRRLAKAGGGAVEPCPYLPKGWSVRPDPDDPNKVVFVREPGEPGGDTRR